MSDPEPKKPLFTPEEIRRLRETAQRQAAQKSDDASQPLPNLSTAQVHEELHHVTEVFTEVINNQAKMLMEHEKILVGSLRFSVGSLVLAGIALAASLRRLR